jgi:hypothetical protein
LFFSLLTDMRSRYAAFDFFLDRVRYAAFVFFSFNGHAE